MLLAVLYPRSVITVKPHTRTKAVVAPQPTRAQQSFVDRRSNVLGHHSNIAAQHNFVAQYL